MEKQDHPKLVNNNNKFYLPERNITQYKKNKNNLTSGRLPGSQMAICAGRPCYR